MKTVSLLILKKDQNLRDKFKQFILDDYREKQRIEITRLINYMLEMRRNNIETTKKKTTESEIDAEVKIKRTRKKKTPESEIDAEVKIKRTRKKKTPESEIDAEIKIKRTRKKTPESEIAAKIKIKRTKKNNIQEINF
ncbi:MAG: hypothetical protein U1E31_02985 [Rickettsiales bacterium]